MMTDAAAFCSRPGFAGPRGCRFSLGLAATAGLAAGLELLGADLGALALTPAAIDAGAVWAIWSGPLLHLSGPHLLVNAAALLIIGAVFEPLLGWRFAASYALVAVAVAAAFLVLHGDLSGYYGLSSHVHGLLAAGAVAGRRALGRAAGVILLALLGKCVFELSAGAALTPLLAGDSSAYGEPVPWTHAAGAAAGAMCGCWFRTRSPAWARARTLSA